MKKYKEITLMSAFLCLVVIMIHITAVPSNSLTVGSVWHTLMFSLNRSLNFAVPGFIFLSGFKLYSKYGKKRVALGEFFKGRLLKIVVPYLISVGVYFACMLTVGWVSFAKLPEYIFLGTISAHFYYVIIALQLYLLFPLLKWAFEKTPILLTAVSLALTLCFNYCVLFKYSDRFFATYVFYFVIGMLLAKYKPYANGKAFGIVSVAAALAVGVPHITVLYNAVRSNDAYEYFGIVNVLYVTLSIVAILSVFYWISHVDLVCKFARVLDAASYEIYLYHLLPLLVIERYITPNLSLSIREQFLLSFVVIYSLALLYSYLKNRLVLQRRSKKTA